MSYLSYGNDCIQYDRPPFHFESSSWTLIKERALQFSKCSKFISMKSSTGSSLTFAETSRAYQSSHRPMWAPHPKTPSTWSLSSGIKIAFIIIKFQIDHYELTQLKLDSTTWFSRIAVQDQTSEHSTLQQSKASLLYFKLVQSTDARQRCLDDRYLHNSRCQLHSSIIANKVQHLGHYLTNAELSSSTESQQCQSNLQCDFTVAVSCTLVDSSSSVSSSCSNFPINESWWKEDVISSLTLDLLWYALSALVH